MSEERTATEMMEILDGCLAAVEEEILAVQDELGRRGLVDPLPASGGREAAGDGAGLLYEWDLPAGTRDIRPDDAVRVSCEAGEALGFVAGYDPRRALVRVASSEWLGPSPGDAILTFDPTWLLSTLASRLGAVEERPEAFHAATALRLFGRQFPRTGRRGARHLPAELLNASQRDALERILGSEVQFVWGPPGTGKTRLLGHAAAELADEGRVLILAMTNVAVDEAAERVAERLGPEELRENRLIRVGAEHSATGRPELSLTAAVDRSEERSPSGLTRLLEPLEAELLPRSARRAPALPLSARCARVSATARGAHEPGLTARLGRLTAEYQRATARALAGADVVLTTFARLAIRDDLQAQRVATVMIDEASTVPLPYAFLGAAAAAERVVAVGDFMQLPAIVCSRGDEARRWLSRDVFREAGVIEGESGEWTLPSPRDQLCSMLVEQYRMRPPIRALVSDMFYGGRLVDAPEVVSRASGGSALALVDTAPLSPRVQRREGSRLNAVHVEVVLQLLEALARRGCRDVGIVAPYRLQARRTARLVRQRLGPVAPEGLEVSTIHRFQGREKTVMILDTVDAPPHSSWFLNEARNPDFPRLLNVALSRSRDLLIVVGTVAGLQSTLPAEALLNRLLGALQTRGTTLDARRLARGVERLFDS